MEKHPKSTIASSSPANSTPTLSTTFVQADANTFRDLVQKLTGFGASVETEKLPGTGSRLSSKPSIIPGTDSTGPRRRRPPLIKLQERRQLHTMRKLEIKLGFTTLRNSSPTQSRQLYFDSSVLPSTPVTPLGSEYSLFYSSSSGTVSPSSPAVVSNSDEEKAIAEKGFYLHPSPLNTPPRGRGTQPPELLTLFPLTSSHTQEKRD